MTERDLRDRFSIVSEVMVRSVRSFTYDLTIHSDRDQLAEFQIGDVHRNLIATIICRSTARAWASPTIRIAEVETGDNKFFQDRLKELKVINGVFDKLQKIWKRGY